MQKKILIGIVIVLAALGISFFVFRKPATTPMSSPVGESSAPASLSPSRAGQGVLIEGRKGSISNPAAPPALSPLPSSPAAVSPAPAVIAVTAHQWAFEPSTIRVKLGQKVTLRITSIDVAHGFALPDFGVNATLEAGKATDVTFTPTKTGSFAFRCSVFCGSGHADMTGTLVVE